MTEAVVLEQWLVGRILGAFPEPPPVYRSFIPMDVNKPAIVFEVLSGTDVLTQERFREYVDFEVDVFAVSARGDRRFPHEQSAALDKAITTGDAVRVAGAYAGVTGEWELTCDRIGVHAMPVLDDAGDYRMSGGRYALRVQQVG